LAGWSILLIFSLSIEHIKAKQPKILMIYYIDEINDKNIYLYSRYRQYYTIIKRLKNYKI